MKMMPVKLLLHINLTLMNVRGYVPEDMLLYYQDITL